MWGGWANVGEDRVGGGGGGGISIDGWHPQFPSCCLQVGTPPMRELRI
jgi:hypothetical protein